MVTSDKLLFGERMREARDRAGLTNRQISERLAKSTPGTPEWYSEIDTLRRNLRRWLRGHNKPGADVLLDYARVVGVSPQFFHGDGSGAAEDLVAPLMRAIEAIVDHRVDDQATRLREVVAEIPADVHPLDAVAQASHYAHGRVLVAQAEVMAGNVADAKEQLEYAIARLEAALGNAQAAA